jgi:hypothetical protein
MHLARDRHDNNIWLGDVLRPTTDNGCWALLESGLVRKRKPDEDHSPNSYGIVNVVFRVIPDSL